MAKVWIYCVVMRLIAEEQCRAFSSSLLEASSLIKKLNSNLSVLALSACLLRCIIREYNRMGNTIKRFAKNRNYFVDQPT